MRMTRRVRHGIPVLAVLFLLITLNQCQVGKRNLQSLDTLRILTRNAPTTYYIGSNEEPRGFEHDLAAGFADSLGVVPKFVIINSVDGILEAMAAGEGDIAAAGLTRTDDRMERFQFGPGYFNIQQQVVYRRGGPNPDSIPDLVGLHMKVIQNSSYTERLSALQERYPGLTWEMTTALSTEELMRHVVRGSLDVTVADANIIRINQRYYPELRVAFPISETQQLAWILSERVPGLEDAVHSWFEEIRSSGQLAVVRERYYGHATIFDYVDIRAFHRRIESRLPRYEPLFRQAAGESGLPWTLLAAQSYQESHWRAHAISPTGVRGLMMLTQITARSLGVTNRLDPKQSVMGGAEYMLRLLNRLPDGIPERQQIRFALAAYNVGMGHLRDARTLAERLGHDPDRWQNMEEVLPLLSHREYYTTLKYGYARGTEPVRYVNRVLNYRDILENSLQ